MGMETSSECNPGLGMAAESNSPFIGKCLKFYNHMSFIKQDGSINYDTIVKHTSDLLRLEGMKETNNIQTIAGFTLYPKEYFCPFDYVTKEMKMTPNTRSIHHYNASWVKRKHKIYAWIKRCLGEKIASFLSGISKRIK